ncbi:MAG TPA: hypothetical protein DEF12_04310 [Rhodobacteraceae bacterium]|nr:hypothetical protein [Paracoccaceae bacterium]
MNKAITDGILFTPSSFSAGLSQWSSGDGVPGSDSYQNAANAAFVPADQDFSGCLELQKTQSLQKLRFKGQTPILPGCYLRVTARIKAISGALPSVRIAGFAAGPGGAALPGVLTTGASVALTSYGQVVEVSAIVGTGARAGVTMAWGLDAIYGHFGLDLTGPNGGTVRIDDIEIEDITGVFLRDMLGTVDVRDFGAKGDGVANDAAAFLAADAAANGRLVVVPEGTYFLDSDVTIQSHIRFEGHITMPVARVLSLAQDYHLAAYIDAFGDEVLAFKKAWQCLINASDHESLDLCGRRIDVKAPIDMAAAVPNRTEYAQRRVIRNGQFFVGNSSDWDDTVVTSQASYAVNQPLKLTGVVNVANVPVGALITGVGVGREVYVRSKNVATQEIELLQPLYDAAGAQVYTFRRFKYVLDFSGFAKISKIIIADVEFNCSGRASCLLMAPAGLIFQVRDCVFNDPKDRAITSHGEGCQGMLIDRNQFLSAEVNMAAQDRKSIAFNTNGNDVKIRDNRITQHRHFAVIAGTSNLFAGNHWYQGDATGQGVRLAGLVMTQSNCRNSIVGNYIDNCFLEWTNEHDPAPDFSSEYSFAGLTVSQNVFQCGHTVPWFTFIVLKPYGPGHFIQGLCVTGNTFRTIGNAIDRVESVDTSLADLDWTRCRNVWIKGNSFNGVSSMIENPRALPLIVNTAASTWTLDTSGLLPFGGRVRNVEAVVPRGPLRTGANAVVWAHPYVETERGTGGRSVELVWPQALKGTASVTVRIDN